MIEYICLLILSQQLLEVGYPPLGRTKSRAAVVNCVVNYALVHTMPNVQQMLLRFVSIVHSRLIDSLLDDAHILQSTRLRPCLFGGHLSGGTKAGVATLRSRSVACSACGSAVMLEDEELTCITRRALYEASAVTGGRHCTGHR